MQRFIALMKHFSQETHGRQITSLPFAMSRCRLVPKPRRRTLLVILLGGLQLLCWQRVGAQETLEPSTYSENGTGVLTIGYITTVDGPDAFGSEGSSISGAMTLAVENINRDPNILPNHTLNFVYADNKGHDLRSINVLTELWKDDAIAFIGPEDFCATEARVAASWKLPMVSYVSTACFVSLLLWCCYKAEKDLCAETRP